MLLKPAFSLGNAALWGAPVVVLLLGLWLLLRTLRNRPADEALSPEEAARLDDLSRD